MERLTTRNSMGIAVYKQPYDCEQCGEGISRLPDLGEGSPTDRLAEYEELEKQGLLLRLPCKIGTTVYYVQKCQAPSCKECLGFTRVNNCYCDFKSRIFEQKFDYRHLGAFGHSVFLTQEAAEQALAEMQIN